MQTIWSPYGPTHSRELDSSLASPLSHPHPGARRPERGTAAPVGVRAAGICGPGTTWQPGLARVHLSPSNPKLEDGEIILDARVRVKKASAAGIRVAESRFRVCRRISHPSPAPQHFCGAHLGVTSAPSPLLHGCCLQGLFGSSALHTLSLAASQGWPRGPDYATSTTSQPSWAGWRLTPDHRTLPHASIVETILPNLSFQPATHVPSTEGQILDQTHRNTPQSCGGKGGVRTKR